MAGEERRGKRYTFAWLPHDLRIGLRVFLLPVAVGAVVAWRVDAPVWEGAIGAGLISLFLIPIGLSVSYGLTMLTGDVERAFHALFDREESEDRSVAPTAAILFPWQVMAVVIVYLALN